MVGDSDAMSWSVLGIVEPDGGEGNYVVVVVVMGWKGRKRKSENGKKGRVGKGGRRENGKGKKEGEDKRLLTNYLDKIFKFIPDLLFYVLLITY